MSILIRIIRLTFRYKRRLLLAYLSVLSVTVFALAIPGLIGTAVDDVLTSTSQTFMVVGGVAVVAVVLLLLIAFKLMSRSRAIA